MDTVHLFVQLTCSPYQGHQLGQTEKIVILIPEFMQPKELVTGRVSSMLKICLFHWRMG